MAAGFVHGIVVKFDVDLCRPIEQPVIYRANLAPGALDPADRIVHRDIVAIVQLAFIRGRSGRYGCWQIEVARCSVRHIRFELFHAQAVIAYRLEVLGHAGASFPRDTMNSAAARQFTSGPARLHAWARPHLFGDVQCRQPGSTLSFGARLA